jgi:hypothetical protein
MTPAQPLPSEPTRDFKAEAAEIAKIHEKRGHTYACTWCGEPLPTSPSEAGELRAEIGAKFDEYYDGGKSIVIPADESPTDWFIELFAHQTQQREAAAYERGRIAEAKTCQEAQRHNATAARIELLQELLDTLPEAVFVPDGSTSDAVSVGVGLSQYRLKMQLQLIDRLQKLNLKKGNV